MRCLRIAERTTFVIWQLNAVIKSVVDRLYIQQLEYKIDRADIPDNYI